MRVALLTRRLDNEPTNGFERYAHNLCWGLRSMSVDLNLPCQHSPLPVRPSGSFISPIYYDVFLSAWRLMRGQMDSDVVHALTDSQSFFFPFLRGMKVVTFHHVDKTPPGSPQERLFCWFYSIGTRLSLKHADHFICISEQTKDEVMEAYGVLKEKITVIPQAIPEMFQPRKVSKEGWTVGYIGALKKRKNVETLIRAFSIAKSINDSHDMRLVICGEGPDDAMLRDIAKSLGDSVEFRGLVPEDQLVDTYNSFDVFVFPSYQEGFGFPILEAQACGLPVLTLEGAMIPEEVSRYTLKCAGEQGLADAIIKLRDDPMLRQKTINASIQYAATFSVRTMAERTYAVYKRLIEGGPRQQALECDSR